MTDEENTFRDFRQSIELMADEVENAIEEYDTEPGEAVWQEVDSSQWVIYNDMAMKAIQYAHEEPDEWKYLVTDDSGFWEIVQAYAYKSVEGELYRELRDRDVL